MTMFFIDFKFNVEGGRLVNKNENLTLEIAVPN